MLAWIMSRLTAQIALPIMAVMLVANIGTGIALEITRITLQHRTEDLAAEKKAHDADIATYKAATATAQALDQQHALTVKEGQDQVTSEKQHDLENQLVSARANAANFVRQHPAPAIVSSRGNNSPVPAASDASGSVDGAPGSTVISASDADACAVAYTVAVGWQSWWAKEQPIWQAGSTPDLPALGAIVVGKRLAVNAQVRQDLAVGPNESVGPVSMSKRIADFSQVVPRINRPVDLLAAVTVPQVVEKESQPQNDEKGSKGESDRE